MQVIITGKVGDSSATPALGRIEFSQVQRLDTGEMMVTSTHATAQVINGELRNLQGGAFTLPSNPTGTAVRIREMLGGETFEWYAAVPEEDSVEYRLLPLVESEDVPESVFGPPAWIQDMETTANETIEAINNGIDMANALGGLAGINQAVTDAETAANNSASSAQDAQDVATSLGGLAGVTQAVADAEAAASAASDSAVLAGQEADRAAAVGVSRVIKRVRLVAGWGQSNMSGRGIIASGDSRYQPVPARLLQYGFTNRTLRAATPVLDNMDVSTGIGPLYDFGLHLLQNINDEDIVVLVPAAQGGTPLVPATGVSWNPTIVGGLYQNARDHLIAARAAAQLAYPDYTVVVEAMLWHQGEGDGAATTDEYRSVFKALATAFRTVTGADTPIVIGQLQPKNITGNRYNINQAHTMIARQVPFCAFAEMPRNPANDIGDGTHYNAVGQRVLAKSMWDAYLRARVNLMPKQKLQSGANAVVVQDNFDIAGEVLVDLMGNTWEAIGNVPTNAARFISDGTFVKIDPTKPGQTRSFLLTDCSYTRRVTVLTQWGGASVKTYRIILAFANAEDYLFISVDTANFRLGWYKDGATTILATSAVASATTESIISIGSNTVNGTSNGVALGGGFPFTLPADFVGGTMYGVSMQAADSSLLNRLTISLMDARPE